MCCLLLLILIVVVLMVLDGVLIDEVMSVGVNGFVLKLVCFDDIFVVFLVVMDGEFVILCVLYEVGLYLVSEDVFGILIG